ncbi:MAG: transcription initiation factor IIB, partial [Nitrosopumilales archaeon]|nr:transcription initiation factor IIB [Nitrosopumilales archaeon]
MQTSIVCSVCNKNNETVTDPDSGELICGNCGTVLLENIVESGPE